MFERLEAAATMVFTTLQAMGAERSRWQRP